MRARAIASTIGVAGVALVAASPALGAHHLVRVTEVFPGTTGNAGAEFVELQLPASGENLVAGQASVVLYNAAGTQTNAATFSSNPPNGQSQRTMLVATDAAGVAPDLTLPPADALSPAGGAACFNSTIFGSVDCVRWGSSTPPPSQSPSGNPAVAIPGGSSLTRSIARGCATLLETIDDTDDSAADFAAAAPTPRNNATPPTETACDGGGGGGDTEAPNTKIKKGPEGEIDSDTAKVKFKSNEPGSTFECKLDRRKYRSCRSPKRLRNLDDGKHKFKVRATDAAGNTDPSPAKLKFRVDT